MPNHVSNKLSFIDPARHDYKKEQKTISDLLVLMKSDKSPFDFDKLIPYPEMWATADKAFHEAEQKFNAEWKAAREAKIPFTKNWSDLPPDGYNRGGYEWCVSNWGTKWNAYSISYDDESICFKTAWRTPIPIFVEISKRFPDLKLKIAYADEDRGYNCGLLLFKNGKLIRSRDEKAMSNPKLFADALINEIRVGKYYGQLQKAKALLKELTGSVPDLED